MEKQDEIKINKSRNYLIQMNLSKYILALFIFSISLIGCKQHDSDKLVIAVAANMQFAIKEIITSFSSETDIECDLVVSSSGILTAQIMEGAPFDLFLSADMKFPNELYRSGLTLDAPAVYAYGKLVIWTMINSLDPTPHNLISEEIKHIAIANPKTAPYGKAAMETLENLNLYSGLKSKLVYGESVSQTNQFIISHSSEIGFSAKSVVLSPGIANKGNWKEIDEKLYTPIQQGVVIIKSNKKDETKAKKFFHFLFSNKAKEILRKFGYSIEENIE